MQQSQRGGPKSLRHCELPGVLKAQIKRGRDESKTNLEVLVLSEPRLDVLRVAFEPLGFGSNGVDSLVERLLVSRSVLVGEESFGSFDVLLGRKTTERSTDETSDREVALEAKSDLVVVRLEPTPEFSLGGAVASKTGEEVRDILVLDFV